MSKKITPPKKEEILQQYIIDNNSISFCCNHFHVSKPIFTKWLRQYDITKSKELSDLCRKKTFMEKYNSSSVGSVSEFHNKQKRTCKEKYGVENPFQCKDFHEKAKQTCLQKYGVESPRQSQEVKEKARLTCLQKYGVESYSQTPEYKTRIKNTCLNKYGVTSFTKTKEYSDKSRKTKLSKYGNENYVNIKKVRQTKLERYNDENYVNIEKAKQTKLERYGDQYFTNIEKTKQTKLLKYNNPNYTNPDKRAETILRKYGVNNFVQKDITHYDIWSSKDLMIEYLKSCSKKPTMYELSNYFTVSYSCVVKKIHEFDLISYIDFTPPNSHYEREIIEYIQSLGVDNIEQSNRTILSGNKELDIYCPDQRTAIEFNGDYWHCSENKVDKKYHSRKSQECEELGIRLIHIYEYLWNIPQKQLIYKSIIKNALGGNGRKIYARQCEVRELTSKDVEKFSEENSLRGHRPASIYTGLFFNDELVEVMSWGHPFFANKTNDSIEYECIRSISKLGTTVIGGMQKLFKYFIQKYKPNKLLYYVDYNTHNGNSMSFLGFHFESYSGYGIVNVSLSKEAQDKFGIYFNRKPSHHKEIKQMIANGDIITIYDAGVKRYVWEAHQSKEGLTCHEKIL